MFLLVAPEIVGPKLFIRNLDLQFDALRRDRVYCRVVGEFEEQA